MRQRDEEEALAMQGLQKITEKVKVGQNARSAMMRDKVKNMESRNKMISARTIDYKDKKVQNLHDVYETLVTKFSKKDLAFRKRQQQKIEE